MPAKHTAAELNKCSKKELITIILSLEEQLERMNGKCESI